MTGDTSATGVESISPAKADAWVHLAATFDGTVLRAYVNGVKEAEVATSFFPGKRLAIGGDGYADRYFNGSIDEVAIYKEALTAQEIKAYYALFK